MCLGYRLLQDVLGAMGTKKVEEHCYRLTIGDFPREITEETKNEPFPTYLAVS